MFSWFSCSSFSSRLFILFRGDFGQLFNGLLPFSEGFVSICSGMSREASARLLLDLPSFVGLHFDGLQTPFTGDEFSSCFCFFIGDFIGLFLSGLLVLLLLGELSTDSTSGFWLLILICRLCCSIVLKNSSRIAVRSWADLASDSFWGSTYLCVLRNESKQANEFCCFCGLCDLTWVSFRLKPESSSSSYFLHGLLYWPCVRVDNSLSTKDIWQKK